MNLRLKRATVEYLEKGNIPVLAFEINNYKMFGYDEMTLYFNPKTSKWYGEKICECGFIDMEEDEVCEIKNILIKSNKLIYTDMDIFKYLQYCFDNNLYNYEFHFIVINNHKYIPIDCINNDYFCEEFDTLSNCYIWLFDDNCKA